MADSLEESSVVGVDTLVGVWTGRWIVGWMEGEGEGRSSGRELGGGGEYIYSRWRERREVEE